MADFQLVNRRLRRPALGTSDEDVLSPSASDHEVNDPAPDISESMPIHTQEAPRLAPRGESHGDSFVNEFPDRSLDEIPNVSLRPSDKGRSAVRSYFHQQSPVSENLRLKPIDRGDEEVVQEPEGKDQDPTPDLDQTDVEQLDAPPSSRPSSRGVTTSPIAHADPSRADRAETEARRRRIARGVMGGVQGILGIAGAAAGLPGLAAISGLFGAAGRQVDPQAPIEKLHREEERRKDANQEVVAEEQRQIENERAQQNTDINQINADSNAQRTSARLEFERERWSALHDPAHREAARARDRFMSAVDMLDELHPGLRQSYEPFLANLDQSSAEDVNRALSAFQYLPRPSARAGASAGVAPGGGGGRGRGHGGAPRAPRGQDWSQPLSQEYERVAQELFRRRDDDTPIETYRAMVMNVLTKQARSEVVMGAVGQIGTRRTEAEGSAVEQQQRELHFIPGWRHMGQTRLNGDFINRLRGNVINYNAMSAAAREMEQIAQQVGMRSRAGQTVGMSDPLMARAIVLQSNISSAIRRANDFGVPNGPELAIAERQAPRIESVDGFLNAVNKYRALRHAYNIDTMAWMTGSGYLPEDSSR